MKTNPFIKCIAILVLFTGVTVFSFAESFFITSIGPYWMNEDFTQDDYLRVQAGTLTNFTFYYFPQKTSLGLLTQLSIGSFDSGREATKTEMNSLGYNNGSDFRINVAPALYLKFNEKVGMPFAVGPVFSFYWEERSSSYYGYDDIFGDIDYSGSGDSFYEAFGVGLMANIGVSVNPCKVLSLMNGLIIDWDFLRFERGQMPSAFRHLNNFRFESAPYSALTLSLTFGIGFHFE